MEATEMKVGTRLDAHIEAKVMGSTFWLNRRGEYEMLTLQKEGKREPYRRHKYWKKAKDKYRKISLDEYDPHEHGSNIDHYSRDISAAWQIVEKMRECSTELHECQITESHDGVRVSFGRHWMGEWEEHGFGFAETAPHAICIAALRALDTRERR